MGNPILDPIFSFFSAIWNGLANMWNGLVAAIVNWFSAVWSYQYLGIPVGPVLFIGMLILAFVMIWGFVKLKELFGDDE